MLRTLGRLKGKSLSALFGPNSAITKKLKEVKNNAHAMLGKLAATVPKIIKKIKKPLLNLDKIINKKSSKYPQKIKRVTPPPPPRKKTNNGPHGHLANKGPFKHAGQNDKHMPNKPKTPSNPIKNKPPNIPIPKPKEIPIKKCKADDIPCLITNAANAAKNAKAKRRAERLKQKARQKQKQHPKLPNLVMKNIPGPPPKVSQILPKGLNLSPAETQKISDLIKQSPDLFKNLLKDKVPLDPKLFKLSPTELNKKLKAELRKNTMYLKKPNIPKFKCEPKATSKNNNNEHNAIKNKRKSNLNKDGYVHEWDDEYGDLVDVALKKGVEADSSSFKDPIPSISNTMIDIFNSVNSNTQFNQDLQSFISSQFSSSMTFEQFLSMNNVTLSNYLLSKGINIFSQLTFSQYLKMMASNMSLSQYFKQMNVNINSNMSISTFLSQSSSMSKALFNYLAIFNRRMESKLSASMERRSLAMHANMSMKSAASMVASNAAAAGALLAFCKKNMNMNMSMHC